jgi:serine/threonine-protein kinase
MAEGVSRIGRYEIAGKLTTGGMAEIFLGRLTGPRGFEKPVVIKRILGHLRSMTFAEMFLDEARIVADIRHPNVVQVFDFGEEAGELFIAMEYLEGESLGGILRRLWATQGALDPPCAALIAAAACAGLHAAHELKDKHGRPLGLVHRDVSPSNIFVTYDGHVKVIDFGVAKAQGAERRTDAGHVRGKSGYMSPEQALAQDIDRRSDIFSLGIVLFEMCTMRRLFQRDNSLLVYRAICEEPIPSMTEVNDAAPAELDRIARRALERSRDARYPTAQAMRRELLAAARGLTAREPEEVLSEMMHELFSDRIEQKNALRWGIEHGRTLEQVPEAETDLGATIPSLGLDEAKSRGATALRWGSRARTFVALGAAVGAGFLLAGNENSPAEPAGPRASSVSPSSAALPPDPPAREAMHSPLPAPSNVPVEAKSSVAPRKRARAVVPYAEQPRPRPEAPLPSQNAAARPVFTAPADAAASFRRFD